MVCRNRYTQQYPRCRVLEFYNNQVLYPRTKISKNSTKIMFDLCINLGALAPWSTNSVSNIYCISSVLPYCCKTTDLSYDGDVVVK